MGLRFRRSIRLAPGFRVNLSKTGSSLSIGQRGETVNVSKRGTKTTLGIPGLGLSYSTMSKRPASASDVGSAIIGLVIFGLIVYLLILL